METNPSSLPAEVRGKEAGPGSKSTVPKKDPVVRTFPALSTAIL